MVFVGVLSVDVHVDHDDVVIVFYQVYVEFYCIQGQKDESNLINVLADRLSAIGDEVVSAADSQLDSTLTEVTETAPPSSSLKPRVVTKLHHVGNWLLASDFKFTVRHWLRSCLS